MTLSGITNSYLIRILAIISLFLSLREAAHFLTAPVGSHGSLENLGAFAFFLSLAFIMFRLFASVGMWINAKWGALLAIVIITLEFLILSFSVSNIYISNTGIYIRIGLALGLVLYFALSYIIRRKADNIDI